ncbi:NAD(P)/FAD-dependent oxidoreductase [Caulobacter sp. HMWF025]|uniref:NAD(P)/FAD-dependent oxidoreductase n=2 Tax=unclassified Caulobacter TaxID=2648921 RepID=UPI000D3C8690|nr:FAD-dependent oxidoreductase [Caulobacter sp. HMWF025]PTT06284.1 pyridine nucleotide-disulfide oxidoreductase [Caulobacter sp. HMWF025]
MTVRSVTLVGAGHAHLHVVRQAVRLRSAGLTVTLIAPALFHYSGLASGVLSGALALDEAQIDVAALAAAFGVRHLAQSVVAVDRAARILTLADGATEPYDRLSLNIGSVAVDPHGLVGGPGVWPVKPLSQLLTLRARIEAQAAAGAAAPRIVVAGGGPSALEIAASLCGLVERGDGRPQVTVIAPRHGAGLPPAAWSRLSAALAERGAVLRSGLVVARTSDSVRLADGALEPCDILVLAAGLSAPPLIGQLGLPLDGEGRLRVMPTLQAIGDPAIFAVGDCAVIEGHTRPAAGVFGVRAAPVLLNNLVAQGDDRPTRAYHPQSRWLSIMDLGEGRGLAVRGRLWLLGRAALWLKRYLDLGFIRRMRAPPASSA